MIEMIAGVYGLPVKQPDGTTRIVGMGPKSGPFSVSPEREAELVAKKIARYVEPPKDDEGDTTGTAAPAAPAVPEYSASMKADQLREIGKQHGLTFKVGMTKAEMVAELDKHFSEVTAEDETEGDTTGTEGGEDAPTFDAADAVQ